MDMGAEIDAGSTKKKKKNFQAQKNNSAYIRLENVWSKRSSEPNLSKLSLSLSAFPMRWFLRTFRSQCCINYSESMILVIQLMSTASG